MIDIESETLRNALNRHRDAGKTFNSSVLDGKGRFYGYLGEEIVKQEFPIFTHADKFGYDLRIDRYTFDVKTKTRKDPPCPRFDATVQEKSMHQKPDYYIFVQILAPQSLYKKPMEFVLSYEYQTAWILGYIRRKDFYERARYFGKGDKDPDNGHVYKAGVNMVSLSELTPIEILRENIDTYKRFDRPCRCDSFLTPDPALTGGCPQTYIHNGERVARQAEKT